MVRFWVWEADVDAVVVANKSRVRSIAAYNEERAAELYAEHHWFDYDGPFEVHVVVVKQIEGKTLEELFQDRKVYRVFANTNVTFSAISAEDDE